MAAQAASGAVRYDISYDPERGRWYLAAFWTRPGTEPPSSLGELRDHRVLAVDVNAGHLACWVVCPDGNPVGPPVTIGLDLAGLPASTRDGRLRAAISTVIRAAKAGGCAAVVIEDLDFEQARAEGRDRTGRHPSRGRAGRRFRRLVSGIPTARFRDRLAQMAGNTGLAVIAVDPAYTSRWGAWHWLGALKQTLPDATVTGHHAAAVVIGRRGLGQRTRRRARCAPASPADGQGRAAGSAAPTAPAMTAGLAGPRTREPGDREARGQPHEVRRKTRPAGRHPRATRRPRTRPEPPVTVPISLR